VDVTGAVPSWNNLPIRAMPEKLAVASSLFLREGCRGVLRYHERRGAPYIQALN
jgi:hypothetical protein